MRGANYLFLDQLRLEYEQAKRAGLAPENYPLVDSHTSNREGGGHGPLRFELSRGDSPHAHNIMVRRSMYHVLDVGA